MGPSAIKKISKKIKPAKRIKGSIVLPGDKSISHRAVMIGSISKGPSKIDNFLNSEDCIATIEAFRRMGVVIRREGRSIVIYGAGLRNLTAPRSALDLGNSGTSMRLLLGILAGQAFESVLIGDESLSNRPMKRVTAPLRQMGAEIHGKEDAAYAPITIKGGELQGIDYTSPVASAQVKSAILLAGLYAKGTTSVTEPFKSRDHTERMLKFFGADIFVNKLKVSVKAGGGLKGRDIHIPGDISSASFFIVAALLLKGSEILIQDVGLNQTRTGLIDTLRKMGGNIEAKNVREGWEPMCNLVIRSSGLTGITIEESEIPRVIDELPVLMTAAAFARGRTVINGAGELRVKETDRIASMLYNLCKMGADISDKGSSVTIEGIGSLHGSPELKSFADHRTAMAVATAGICSSSDDSIIDDVRCIDTSFPHFFEALESVAVR